MAIGKKIHWIGAALIFVSVILLLITSISAVHNEIGIVKVNLVQIGSDRNASITFGSFGYCVNDRVVNNTVQTYCTPSVIGYNLSQALESTLQIPPSESMLTTSHFLTNLLVLHPIACAAAFVAFVSSCSPGIRASLVGSLVAGLAAVLTLIVMIIDFDLFGTVLNTINDKGGPSAEFSTGIWTLVAAMVLLAIGMILVFFTCCALRRERGKQSKKVVAKTQKGIRARQRR